MADFERDRPRSGVVWGQVIAGVFAVPALHLLAALGLWGLWAAFSLAAGSGVASYGLANDVQQLGLGWLLTMGCNQVIYVGPPMGVAMGVQRVRGVGIGMLIGMALTLVLQGACYGIFWATVSLDVK